MADKPAGTGSLLPFASVITLIVTLLRLVGELQGWNAFLFNAEGPGPESRQGWFGITLLIPIFGFWFGARLRRNTGEPAHAGRAAVFHGLAAAVLFGGFALAMQTGLIQMPSKEAPAAPTGMAWALVFVAAAIAVAFAAWPRLSALLFAYALLARIPVVAITFLADSKGWDTHYTKLPPDFVLPDGMTKPVFLAVPQLTFWIAFTMLVGGLFGALGAACSRRAANGAP
jgi:hypothetical protein